MYQGIPAQLEQLLAQFPYSEYGLIGLGVALIFFGRRLYWLATGGLGFVLGVLLAHKIAAGASLAVELVIAVIAGLIGAFFAVYAQQIAVTLVGLVVGAGVAYMVGLMFAEELGATIFWVVFMGGLFGLIFSAFVFETALTAVTSALGGLMVVSGFQLKEPIDLIVLVALTLVGFSAQSRLMKRRRYYESGSER